MTITGQAIHEIYVHRESTAMQWDRISERSQEHYNMLADALNAQYLAPLQGLVREQSALLQECYEVIEAEYGNGPTVLDRIKDVQERVK